MLDFCRKKGDHLAQQKLNHHLAWLATILYKIKIIAMVQVAFIH